MYNIGEFAKLINKSVKTLQRWDREGILIAKRSPKGRRYYTDAQLLTYKGLISNEDSKTIAYIRVSSNGQKDDLKNQKDYINEYCKNAGIFIDEWFSDIGSGLNYTRKNFNRLLTLVESGKVKKVIVSHKDRFVRFGFEWFETFCNNHGATFEIINDERLSPEHELVQDLISIIHVFSCRIYGLRKYKAKIKEDKEINESI